MTEQRSGSETGRRASDGRMARLEQRTLNIEVKLSLLEKNTAALVLLEKQTAEALRFLTAIGRAIAWVFRWTRRAAIPVVAIYQFWHIWKTGEPSAWAQGAVEWLKK